MELTDKSRILVVDDEPRNVKLLEANLLPQGYEILTAFNGQEALDKIAESRVDLILLDVMMPDMDGFEVTKKIRADENSRLIPIVLVTALRETEDRIKGIESGCDDFISKPFDKNEVLARVKTLLNLSYYRRQLDEKEKFEAVINEMSEGIIVCDSEWKIKDINTSAHNFLNITKLDGANLLDFICQDGQFSASVSKKELADTLRSQMTFDIVRKETEQTPSLHLESRIDMLKNPAGEVSSIVMTLHDVTGERRQEMMKQDFLSLISHKLRTPMTVIVSIVSMLDEGLFGPLTEKQKENVKVLLDKSYGFGELLDKLVGFVTITSDRLDLSKEQIDLQKDLSELMNSKTNRVKDKKIELNITCADNQINLNKTHFDLIMRNLLENAIKFNDSEVIKIDISALSRADKVEILFSDNGKGIPSEDYERIFEKFYQVEKFFTGNVEGIGLGLALVKRLVDAYGGKISVDSHLEKGTTFKLSFPNSRE